jgi:mRNA interferase HigB
VNVIGRRKLRDFYQARPERRQHGGAFEDWYKIARRAEWDNFQEAKATFVQTDVASGGQGKTATIFDVGGNKCRIVANIDYMRKTVLIVAVLTHAEYDKGIWKRLF